jgi:hypothetical protein
MPAARACTSVRQRLLVCELVFGAIVQVKNLPWAASEKEIGAFFSACGPVSNVWRGVNPRDGKPHHFTHVQVRPCFSLA